MDINLKKKNVIKKKKKKKMDGKGGYIELIIGPMYASKTSTLIARAERFSIAGKKCLVVKYAGDNRYSSGDEVHTHNGRKYEAIKCKKLSEIDGVVSGYDVVLIDEGQFFVGLVGLCDSLAGMGKIVVVSALDGNFKREPFGEICMLVPRAERILKLSAVCTECGEDAYFTKRIVGGEKEELIGGVESYKAVCRGCYKKK